MTNKQEPIFVSYAHQGKGSQFISLCEDALFAANMERSTWTDQEIESGDKWQEKIESALSKASAAVIYVDWEFLKRPYVQTKELPAILTRAAGMAEGDNQQGIPMIAILVESCLYDRVMPWLNALQIEPEHSMRRRVDPRKERYPDLLTLSDLSDTQLAQFKTELAKRFITATANRSRSIPPAEAKDPQRQADEERREGGLARYLRTGEELIGNYVEVQVSLRHSQSQCYRVDLRFAYNERKESRVRSWRGRAQIHPHAMVGQATVQAQHKHPAADLMEAVLSSHKEDGLESTTVEKCVSDALTKAAYMSVPLQLSIRISVNASELQEIPWETIDWRKGSDGAEILFSRTLLSSGDDAVECQTRARIALRVLSIYSDLSTRVIDGADPSRHTAIQTGMARSLEPLSVDERGSTKLLRPDCTTMLHHLSASASYDVLYLACEAVQRGCEVYLRLADAELSEAQLRQHFTSAPVPRLVILAPASLVEGSKIDDQSMLAMLHLAPVFSELGAAGVLTCQSAMSANAWEAFVAAFAQSLNIHGHVAGAVTEARHACHEQQDRWKPVMVTRIKATRMWYEAGFVSEESARANWDSILDSLSKHRFCPVIGPGILYQLQQARLEIAREMADEYDFPLAFSYRISLPAVAQYARALEPTKGVFLRNLEARIRHRLCAILSIEAAACDDTLWGLAAKVAERILSNEPGNPYNILARLPVGLYLNTNLDPLLAVALEAVSKEGKEATIFDFTMVDPTRPDRSGASVFPTSEFKPNSPMVVQFYGSYQELSRAVIAEDDYLEFLASFAGRMRDVEGSLEGKLGTSDLVFLGFKWNSLEFRVLFRALQKYANMTPDDAFHIAVQIDPDDDETIHPEKAIEYLRRYFSGARQLQRARIGLYWGSTEDFLQNLEQRWNERNRQGAGR